MRPRLIPVLVIAAVVVSGCASTPPSISPAATTEPTPGGPSPEAIPNARLVVGIEGVTYEGADEAEEFLFAGAGEGDELLALIEELSGEPRSGEEIEGPYGGLWGTGYEWDEITVTVSGENEDRMSVAVRATEIGGVPVVTADGDLAVGSSREDAVAAGARDGWDADEDGTADYLDLGETEVPGTQSLQNPGDVGIMFVMLGLTGDTISEIQAPANDFSDI
ncbi:hypothetical protein [Microbacterium sp. HJ5]